MGGYGNFKPMSKLEMVLEAPSAVRYQTHNLRSARYEPSGRPHYEYVKEQVMDRLDALLICLADLRTEVRVYGKMKEGE